jgi:ectoine hydroxylase-related dioxygenase (phytanoyl-CoA dioxygenase family)
MQSRITSRGIDCTGIIDGPYRFAEIICRDDGGLRYDVPLPWLGDENDGQSCRNVEKTQQRQQQQQVVGSDRIGAPLSKLEKDGVVDLHMAVDQIVPPVLEALWSRDDDDSSNIDDKVVNSSNTRSSCSYVAAAGFLINEPGSKAQNWHKDGPDPGFINCFVPLIDLTEELGPTAFSLDIHDGKDDNIGHENDENDNRKNVLVPMLNKGNILLFDYRTLHRGQGNTSNDDITRTLAYAVYCRRRTRRRTSPIDDDGVVKESGDVHNFPAALTLEYD